MANLKASKKDILRIKVRSDRNRVLRSKLKTLRKSLDKAVASGNATDASTATATYISALDKAAKKGVVHANKVARHKSAYAKHLAAN